MPIGKIDGLSLQIGVADMAAAREFYDRLFGREPDFAESADSQQYETSPGVWFRITTTIGPGRLRRVRFGVYDLAAARESLLADGLKVGPVQALPGVVAYCDFPDPWGNKLGLYEDLAEPGV
jgi:catechol 2,3-dioxygenase-like lactoylglutathione lyase family enzyme